MTLTDWFSNALLLRKILRAEERQAVALEQIAGNLQRLADRLAPPIIEASSADLRDTGIRFTRDREQVVIQEFVDDFLGKFGREPSDEEVVDYLNTSPTR